MEKEIIHTAKWSFLQQFDTLWQTLDNQHLWKWIKISANEITHLYTCKYIRKFLIFANHLPVIFVFVFTSLWKVWACFSQTGSKPWWFILEATLFVTEYASLSRTKDGYNVETNNLGSWVGYFVHCDIFVFKFGIKI